MDPAGGGARSRPVSASLPPFRVVFERRSHRRRRQSKASRLLSSGLYRINLALLTRICCCVVFCRHIFFLPLVKKLNMFQGCNQVIVEGARLLGISIFFREENLLMKSGNSSNCGQSLTFRY
ncbi:Os12g0477050 [Oryza sativa Japonica Group]|uniref:Os12g0477050 protein n=3 Tax=Oryza sativa TaxID=4530 RepID=A0A0P0YA35_ORYSJ|nr:hypothetical protein OsI_38305 [Oryza sativa Indica Group]EEE53194.1 hypothetical protein OsJ_36066 [Oryza sativa Japonica Group]BAH95677.1 Os12g0477050 [Oryza sativa Japonica Group]BAT17116.1 Os12g0477050 [Oryza sativa Japonica Group]|eukprot:NP_001176949.1 Os12g0477050 [Oryza sativa Japonica Group]